MMGHSSTGIIQSYAKVLDEYRRDAVKKLEEYRRSKVTTEIAPAASESRRPLRVVSRLTPCSEPAGLEIVRSQEHRGTALAGFSVLPCNAHPSLGHRRL
jgi:hypothetical protein